MSIVKSRSEASLDYAQDDRRSGVETMKGGFVMAKEKEISIVIRRVNYNHFIVKNHVLDFLQLVNWFKEFVTKV